VDFSVPVPERKWHGFAPLLTEQDLDALRTSTRAWSPNAIESFNVRLHNTGFCRCASSMPFVFEDAPPTGRLCGHSAPELRGTSDRRRHVLRDRADFWNGILEIPAPRILVLQDMDNPPGRGAFLGDMHAAILKALGCVAYVTNGAVRELPSVRRWACNCSPAAWPFPTLTPTSSRLGDRSTWAVWKCGTEIYCTETSTAFWTVPAEIAPQVPAAADRLQRTEQKIIDFCRSGDFSVESCETL